MQIRPQEPSSTGFGAAPSCSVLPCCCVSRRRGAGGGNLSATTLATGCRSIRVGRIRKPITLPLEFPLRLLRSPQACAALGSRSPTERRKVTVSRSYVDDMRLVEWNLNTVGAEITCWSSVSCPTSLPPTRPPLTTTTKALRDIASLTGACTPAHAASREAGAWEIYWPMLSTAYPSACAALAVALCWAAAWPDNVPLYIWCDCQVAVHIATGQADPQQTDRTSKLLVACRHLFQVLSRRSVPARLAWIPSHMGWPGNELADQVAKAARKQDAPELPECFFQLLRHPRLPWLWHKLYPAQALPAYETLLNKPYEQPDPVPSPCFPQPAKVRTGKGAGSLTLKLAAFNALSASRFGVSKMLSRPRPTLPVPSWKRQPTAGAPTFTSKLQRWTSASGKLAVQHSRHGAQTSGISTTLRGHSSSSARQSSNRSEPLPRAAAVLLAAPFSEPGNMLSEAAEAPM